MMIPEGHFTITKTQPNYDCDHGPCTGYYIEELKLWVFRYVEDETRISFHYDYPRGSHDT